MYISAINVYYLEYLKIYTDLNTEQKTAVINAGQYFFSIKQLPNYLGEILYETHEKTYDLSFIYPDMKGTADSVLVAKNSETGNIDVHVIDYKFGKGVPIQAYNNYQLILYYLGVINDPEVKAIIENEKTFIHLHIVQPFIKNSVWHVTDEERLEIENLKFYSDVVNSCYSPNAKRTPHKKACQFCKAKPTCPALAKTLPNPDIDFFALDDSEIAAIYDKREMINLYMNALEEYIINRITNGGFEDYILVNKTSNRRWKSEALVELTNILGDDAFETVTKLIGIGTAEKLLGRNSNIINKLVTKEITGVEIVKYHSIKNNN
jgi:hypothetical protein